MQRRDFHAVEYLTPILAALLVVAGAWAYYRHLKSRTPPQPPPVQPELRLAPIPRGERS